MGYTPVFDTVFDGSMCGKWPVLPVWLTLLPLADWRGHIDMTPQAIAGRTGWPLELLMQGIHELSQPDPDSRSKADEGRRLVPIDPERSWGWRVVNIDLYRRRCRDANDVAEGKAAERSKRYRERHVPSRAVTAGHVTSPDSDSYTNSDSNKKKNLPPSKTQSVGKTRARPETEFPDDFALDDGLRETALKRSPDCDVEQAFEQFKAHHLSRGSRFKNWRAAWVTWIGNFESFGYPRKRSAPAGMERVQW